MSGEEGSPCSRSGRRARPLMTDLTKRFKGIFKSKSGQSKEGGSKSSLMNSGSKLSTAARNLYNSIPNLNNLIDINPRDADKVQIRVTFVIFDIFWLY